MIKRGLISTIFLVLMTNIAFAGANYRSTTPIQTSAGVRDMAVASTATIFSKSFTLKDVKNDNDVGVMYKATSSGTIALTVEIEQSFRPPTTEGAADVGYMSTAVIEAGISDANWSMATIDTVVMPYGRFKITGTGSNHASTTIEMQVAK